MKQLRDTWFIFLRSMRSTLRTPVFVMLGLFQPICYLLLLGPMFNSIAKAPGFPSGSPLNVFTPGLLVMLGIFGAAYVGFDLIADLRYGIVERLRVTPVSRLALLLGRALRDIIVLLIQSTLLVLIALPLGLRVHPGGILIALCLLVPMGLLTASCSYALALTLRSENALAATVNFFTMPILLLSGILLPLTLAPTVIRAIAAIDPFSYAVNASRALFNGNLADSSIPLGFAILAGLAILALLWAARSFRSALA